MTYRDLPTIWQASQDLNGQWAGLNQPTSGSRFKQALPKGNKPFQLYSLATPNGIKVAIMLEELRELGIAEADYDLYRIDISHGEQFGSDFVAINPNSKIPALLDLRKEQPIRIFESSSILLYLAEQFDSLFPKDLETKTQVMNWLFWQTGAAPFLGGGFGHFFHYAPEQIDYAIDRFAMEAKRQLDLLDKELAKRPYIAGDNYTIADIAIWSWYGRLAQDKIWDKAGVFLDVTQYRYLQDWTQKISKRPAVQRALSLDYQSIH